MYLVPSYHFVFSKSNYFNNNCSNEQNLSTAAWLSSLAHSQNGPISFGMTKNLSYVLNLLLSCTPHALEECHESSEGASVNANRILRNWGCNMDRRPQAGGPYCTPNFEE